MYRYIKRDGTEVRLETLDELLGAVRSGSVDRQTLIFDSSTARWMRAESLPLFTAVERLAAEPTASTHARSTAAPEAETFAHGSRTAPQTAPAPSEVGADDAHMVVCPHCGAHNKPMAGLCFNCSTFLDRVPEAPNPGHVPPAARDVPTEDRSHGIRGKLYIFFAYFGAAIWAVGAVLIMGVGLAEGDGALALLGGLFLAGISVGSYLLARGLSRFKEGARLVALVLLYFGALGSASSMLMPGEPGEQFGGLFSLLFQFAFIHYFHTHKDLFGDRASAPDRRMAIF